jgi:dihydroxyacetone kinase
MRLNHDADMLRVEIQKNYTVIKELENTNNEYKLKINELTIVNESLTQKIKDLEEEVKNQKVMNDTLQQKIQQLEKKSYDEDHKKLLRKYCMAIQDYNNRYEIEKRMNL